MVQELGKIIDGDGVRSVEAEVSIGDFSWIYTFDGSRVWGHLDYASESPVTVSVDFEHHGPDGASIVVKGPRPKDGGLWSAYYTNLIKDSSGYAAANFIRKKFQLPEGADQKGSEKCVRFMTEERALAMVKEIIQTLRSGSPHKGRRLGVVKIL